MTTICVSDMHQYSVQSWSRGESGEAKSLEKSLRRAASATTTRVLRQSAFEEIAEVFADCKEAAWDGYNAAPLKHASFITATKFLEILPSWVAAPEVTPEPDGEIALEWRKGDRVFSLSLGADRVMRYAGILGYKKKIHGTEPFDDSIPQIVLDSIRKIYKETPGPTAHS